MKYVTHIILLSALLSNTDIVPMKRPQEAIEQTVLKSGADYVYNHYKETVQTYFPNEEKQSLVVLNLLRNQKITEAKKYIQNCDKNSFSYFGVCHITELGASYHFTDFVSFCLEHFGKELLSRALTGAAYGGHLDFIQSLQNEYMLSDKKLFAHSFEPAAFMGHTAILQYIASKVEILKLKNRDPLYVAMHSATREGHYDAVKFMLNLGIDSVHDPLLIAIKHGHTEIVKALIAHGAEVNRPHEYIAPLNFLGLAIKKKRLEITKTLLMNGAERDALYATMQSATKKGDRDTIKFILSLGIDFVQAPLLTAVEHGHAEIVEDLIAHGASGQ